jgi:hypothetical protein
MDEKVKSSIGAPFIWIGALVGAGSLWLVQEGLPLY